MTMVDRFQEEQWTYAGESHSQVSGRVVHSIELDLQHLATVILCLRNPGPVTRSIRIVSSGSPSRVDVDILGTVKSEL